MRIRDELAQVEAGAVRVVGLINRHKRSLTAVAVALLIAGPLPPTATDATTNGYPITTRRYSKTTMNLEFQSTAGRLGQLADWQGTKGPSLPA